MKKVLKKRDRIIKKVTARVKKKDMKFGVTVPTTIGETYRLHRDLVSNHWQRAIEKEMQSIEVAFNVLEEEERIPVGYKKIRCHMVFDVKFDLTRKARFVAGGHMCDTPSALTYSSVVSRESRVSIAFLISALNNLDILTADVGNAYLNAKPRENVFFHCR